MRFFIKYFKFRPCKQTLFAIIFSILLLSSEAIRREDVLSGQRFHIHNRPDQVLASQIPQLSTDDLPLTSPLAVQDSPTTASTLASLPATYDHHPHKSADYEEYHDQFGDYSLIRSSLIETHLQSQTHAMAPYGLKVWLASENIAQPDPKLPDIKWNDVGPYNLNAEFKEGRTNRCSAPQVVPIAYNGKLSRGLRLAGGGMEFPIPLNVTGSFTIMVVDRPNDMERPGRSFQSDNSDFGVGTIDGKIGHVANGQFVGKRFKPEKDALYVSTVVVDELGNDDFYVNGEPMGSAAGVKAPQTMAIGSCGLAYEPTYTDVLEIIVWERALTINERITAEADLGTKYSIAMRHPACFFNNGGCDSRVSCTNNVRYPWKRPRCGACPQGYRDISTNGLSRCEDVDECIVGNGGCDMLTRCINTKGSRLCSDCPSGYRGNGEQPCHDIDECEQAHGGCDPQVECINTIGSFKCGSCPSGFMKINSLTCGDIDECQNNNGGCDTLTACINTIGSRQCGECPNGYSGRGETKCLDYDECAVGNGGCDPRTTCINLPGSRACGQCPRGFFGDGIAGCQDINECSANNGGCDALTRCINLEGSRVCGPCPLGYEGNGGTGCRDINECLNDNGGCHKLTKCTNTEGSRQCGDCPAGYTGNGNSGCVDINECMVQDNGGCDKNTQCFNVPGSRMCGPCPKGYKGDGANGCIDLDECKLLPNGGCDPMVDCTNLAGAYQCGNCPAGYLGDGYTGCVQDRRYQHNVLEQAKAQGKDISQFLSQADDAVLRSEDGSAFVAAVARRTVAKTAAKLAFAHTVIADAQMQAKLAQQKQQQILSLNKRLDAVRLAYEQEEAANTNAKTIITQITATSIQAQARNQAFNMLVDGKKAIDMILGRVNATTEDPRIVTLRKQRAQDFLVLAGLFSQLAQTLVPASSLSTYYLPTSVPSTAIVPSTVVTALNFNATAMAKFNSSTYITPASVSPWQFPSIFVNSLLQESDTTSTSSNNQQQTTDQTATTASRGMTLSDVHTASISRMEGQLHELQDIKAALIELQTSQQQAQHHQSHLLNSQLSELKNSLLDPDAANHHHQDNMKMLETNYGSNPNVAALQHQQQQLDHLQQALSLLQTPH